MGRAELPPQSDMPKIMRTWRARRNPDDIPGMSALPRHRHRRGRLTQAIMADLLGVDERHYRRLEHGEGRISKDLVRDCARILGLNPAEASALYVWSGHQPPQAVVPQQPDVPDDLLGMLHRIGHGAYWSDDTYTVLAYNRRAAWHWPWMQRAGANIMEELLAPSSQGREQCRQWETHWAPYMVAELRRSAVVELDNDRIQRVVRRVRRSAEVRRLWDGDERAEMSLHPYATVRPMELPLTGPVHVSVQALAPLAHPGLRMIVGIPVDFTEPELPLGPPPPPRPAVAAP